MSTREMYNRVKLIALEEFGTLQGVDIKLTQNPESGTVTYCVTRKAA